MQWLYGRCTVVERGSLTWNCSQDSNFHKSIGWGPRGLMVATVTRWYVCVYLTFQSSHSGKFVETVQGGGSLRGLQECCYHWFIWSFRFYLLEFKANCGFSFSLSFPCGEMLCPRSARVQGPCQLACANTLLSNDLICNKAKCLCSSSWHRMPGEVTKLLYVPLALAAMVNSPAAFMQMPVNTL